ncbi:Serine--tRNA ligase [Methylorubrum extorquens]|uniref:Serine--tRNA ligase n=1 Tax=Methylorubrum extorquens TaxID=408 RepID=A0A2N9AKC5_METEX|nr:serine--tRNA ligase [Methylorubrum zatmanii]ARO53243.1 serine--tRNA ligase [Methylorubrum zatmanii]KQQ14913.1 serine--tRNA ligase [Methylobacterium sp. Leaf121]SOR27807.1 Serine--tRNA ligase [Methylorubrum extorquens]
MHDIRAIRENPEAFDRDLERRGLAPLSAELIALDDARKAAVSAAQAAQERRNALSKEIGAAKKAKDEARATELMAEVARLKEEAPGLEAAQGEAAKALDERLAAIPNRPKDDVPPGADEHGNVEYRRFDSSRERLAQGRQHFELGEATGLMDFEAAAKLSGSRFVVLKGQLARLERALGQFMLDLHTGEHGYTEVVPPVLVRDEAMFGTAQLPKFRDDQFATSFSDKQILDLFDGMVSQAYLDAEKMASEDGKYQIEGLKEIFEQQRPIWRARFDSEKDAQLRRWLIPTAEVPLTNLVRESILAEDELPLRFTALTPCFRAEAGAAGRDTRGMLRQHQFNKVELVSITAPEKSAEEHERMLACAEAVLQKLDLTYRVMTLCTGDMGFASQKTYDIEVWVPGQQTYREISSCSVCGEFQARRMNARYRAKEGRGVGFVHTLNGSGVAVGRALIAVMENYQNPDGSVTIPSALQPYMGGLTRIEGPKN